jgi:hypothetical protein
MSEELAPRGLRVYKGPSSPARFMGMINSLTHQCRNMAWITNVPGSVYSLTKKLANGQVTVTRANNIDYIWTKIIEGEYLILRSAWSPFVYVYTITGELCWTIDPRVSGNYSSWYQAVYNAEGGAFNYTSLRSGDKIGFDIMMVTDTQWGMVWLTQTFSYSGGMLFSAAVPYAEDAVSRSGCEFTSTRISKGRVIIGFTYWQKRPNPYTWFRDQCDLFIYQLTGAVLGYTTSLSLTNDIGSDFFWAWGAPVLEDDFFYISVYGNKEEYLNYACYLQILKIDYEGNVLAQTSIEQAQTNSGRDFEFDTYSGLTKSNDSYVVYLSPYGQFLKVWDKDLVSIKNISIDASLGLYGYEAAHYEDYKWCRFLGFVKNEVYILTGLTAQPGGGGSGGGYHEVYVYDVSKDAGSEFQRKVSIYVPEVDVFGTKKYEVFDEGITLEGYNQ